MDTPPAASALLATPVITDQDVLDRVNAIITPVTGRDRTLWLFFLGPRGTQANLVVPVDDIPEWPAAGHLGNLCYVAAESISHTTPGGSVVITLSRPGVLRRTPSDRHILRGLQHGAAAHRTPVRMFCLATPEGARELGPVSPAP